MVASSELPPCFLPGGGASAPRVCLREARQEAAQIERFTTINSDRRNWQATVRPNPSGTASRSCRVDHPTTPPFSPLRPRATDRRRGSPRAADNGNDPSRGSSGTMRHSSSSRSASQVCQGDRTFAASTPRLLLGPRHVASCPGTNALREAIRSRPDAVRSPPLVGHSDLQPPLCGRRVRPAWRSLELWELAGRPCREED